MSTSDTLRNTGRQTISKGTQGKGFLDKDTDQTIRGNNQNQPREYISLTEIFQWSNEQQQPAKLHNHLRNTLSTQSLTSNKLLVPDTSQQVAKSGKQQKHGSGNQTRCAGDQTDPLHGAHANVDEGAHVVAGEAADEVIEFGGGGTYTK